MSDYEMMRLQQEVHILRDKITNLVAEIHSLRVEMGYLRDSIPTPKTQTGGIV